jgi:hypothetical protein
MQEMWLGGVVVTCNALLAATPFTGSNRRFTKLRFRARPTVLSLPLSLGVWSNP